jgi:hypothetical protein
MRKIALIGLFLFLAPSAWAKAPAPEALAKRIDALLADKWRQQKIQLAPRADDAEFLRRLSLDLTGRIPRVADVRAFLDDKNPEKRRLMIERLLDDPRRATHFANVWRTLLIPETDASANARFFQSGFETWLKNRLRERVGYDKLVRELLTAPISADSKEAEVVFRRFNDPNPLAFFAVKDAKPENLAAATSRLFLGIQLECAQCHDHPFASWTQDQFWSQAAFFAGIQREGRGVFAPLTETPDRREIAPGPNRKRLIAAGFLDGAKPVFQDKVSSRTALADWITDAKNPYFPKAAVNRVWGSLFGIGIVDPVDNFSNENLPSHPELLDELARAFVASGFDLTYITSAICQSEAYQRTSAQTDPSQEEPRLFARMPVKGLTGEQFFDSLLLATGFDEPQSGGGKGRLPLRGQFLSQFAPQGRLSEPESSVLQALTLMNGAFIADATNLSRGKIFAATVETPGLTLAERIETLYLASLSRRPTDEEMERMLRFVRRVPDAQTDRLADVFWVLLNAAEFRLNH